MPLEVGTLAPDFTLPLAPGEAPLRLADYRGQKSVVLLFFPLAFSDVCTEEICAAAENYSDWTELGAEVIGISVDSPFVNRKFARECGAPFPIVSDFNKETITAYGVRCDDYFGLKGVANRAACVVDRHGRIAWFWMDEDSSKLPDFEALKEAVRKASAG
jgi:glutaredoxin-dependent peroxiredoxin